MEKLVAVKSNKISAQNFYDYIIFMFFNRHRTTFCWCSIYLTEL